MQRMSRMRSSLHTAVRHRQAIYIYIYVIYATCYTRPSLKLIQLKQLTWPLHEAPCVLSRLVRIVRIVANLNRFVSCLQCTLGRQLSTLYGPADEKSDMSRLRYI